MENTRKRSRDHEEEGSASPAVPLSSLLLFVSLSSHFFLACFCSLVRSLRTHFVVHTPLNHSYLLVFCTRSRNHTDHDTLTSTYTYRRACVRPAGNRVRPNNTTLPAKSTSWPICIYDQVPSTAHHTRDGGTNERITRRLPYSPTTVHILPATNKQILFSTNLSDYHIFSFPSFLLVVVVVRERWITVRAVRGVCLTLTRFSLRAQPQASQGRAYLPSGMIICNSGTTIRAQCQWVPSRRHHHTSPSTPEDRASQLQYHLVQ